MTAPDAAPIRSDNTASSMIFHSGICVERRLKMGLWLFAADKEPRRLDGLIRPDLGPHARRSTHGSRWKPNACYRQRGSFKVSRLRPPQTSCTRLLAVSRSPTKWPPNRGGFEIKGSESGVVVQNINHSSPPFCCQELAFSEAVEPVLPAFRLPPLNKGGYNLLDSLPCIPADRINP